MFIFIYTRMGEIGERGSGGAYFLGVAKLCNHVYNCDGMFVKRLF